VRVGRQRGQRWQQLAALLGLGGRSRRPGRSARQADVQADHDRRQERTTLLPLLVLPRTAIGKDKIRSAKGPTIATSRASTRIPRSRRRPPPSEQPSLFSPALPWADNDRPSAPFPTPLPDHLLIMSPAPPSTPDPVMLSIFSNRFMSVAEAMGKTLQQTAISTNIKVCCGRCPLTMKRGDWLTPLSRRRALCRSGSTTRAPSSRRRHSSWPTRLSCRSTSAPCVRGNAASLTPLLA
jgi:hypothetical protein